MSSKRPAPTKRERARNEQALKDLLKVPGNDRCADCNAMNPGWASWSVGVFLCTRCASIHRKLGTHISKVKSLSLDNWESDQVDVLRLIGNIKANAVWNPDPSKHPIPLNTEESDSIMERYVRNKYEYKLFRRDRTAKEQERIKESLSGSSHKDSGAGLSFSRPSGSSGSSGGSSSGASIASNHSSSSYSRPIPPKRSVSASVHKSSGSRSSSPPSKIGQVLGVEPVHQEASFPCQLLQPTTAGLVSTQGVSGGLEDTIRQLRDMGFTDDRRTLDVLKQTGGNVQTTIEILIRMGGGNLYGRKNESAGSGSVANQRTGGSSSNPFDELDRQEKLAQQKQAQQQQQIEQQQEQILQQQQLLRQATLGASNPYGNMYQQNSVLFPHRTGPEQLHASNPFSQVSSIPATPTIPSQFQQQNPYSNPNTIFPQSIPTPPLVQSPIQMQSTGLSATNPYSAQASPVVAGYNPFLTQQTQQVQLPQQFQTTSPFGQTQPTNPQQQFLMQQQTNTYSLSNAPNDLFHPQPNCFPQQQLLPQPTGRLDKSAILSLYNMPHLAPTPPPQPQPEQQQQQQQQQQPQQPQAQPSHQPLGISNTQLQNLAQKFASSSLQGQLDMQRSNSAPVLSPQSNNPFQQQPQTAAVAAPVAQNGVVAGRTVGRGHMTQESVDFGSWMNQSGRHSPDAFASLSFRQ